MKRQILLLTIFLLLFFTTITKNSTKEIEGQIYNTKENIRILENKYEMILLDYNYLTSPENIMNLVMQNLDIDLSSYEANQIKKLHINNNYNENLIFKITKK